ncbi:MAG: DUF3488 domain-containing transglutaminase family protein [Acinetobacter sp.]|nr:DUF3488 domain-containing transglutaminase family protein [Acinetobacter sp.]
MKISLIVPIFLSLGLILIAQVGFSPLYLSFVFVLMMLALFLHFKKQKQDQNAQLSKWLKMGLVGLALVAIYLSYGSFIGVEAGTAALTVFLFGKSLELKNKRDLIIFFNFALFVSASLFLYSQSIWMALMVICCLVSCLFGLYRIQTIEFKQVPQQILTAARHDIGHIFKFIGLAVPFFIILFLFFPRFPPLWHVPIASDQGVTGISDRMSPGDIAELSQSSALAFRIIADLKQLPAQHELYWRAMVLDEYDGTTWTSHVSNQYSFQINRQNLDSQGIRYQYLAADQRQKWVTGLEKTIPLERRLNLHQDYSITPNRLVQRNQPISLLWVGQDFNNVNLELNDAQKKRYTLYPQHLDQQAQALAKRLFDQSQSDPNRYVENVIQWYQQQQFKYSLQPGRLGNHRVDEFLFKSKEGFCEHYASSFVMLMRYVGIPARVVVGYQGGQAAPDEQSWEVRQLDAHAWTEVFLNQQWIRVDPTSIIAPQRLDLGMQNYLSNDQSAFGDEQFSNFKYQQFSALRKLRIWSDYASFQWQEKVVGFDSERQKKWMSLLGIKSNYAFGILIIAGLFAVGVIYYLVWRFRTFNQQTRINRILNRFAQKLSADQHNRKCESFKSWMLRLAHEAFLTESNMVIDENFDLSAELGKLTNLHHEIVYLNQDSKENLDQFEFLLNRYTNILKMHKKTCQKN